MWVNDPISTTPESTIAALASFPGRELVLIAGGQDRGQDYAELGSALARAGAAVIGVPSTGGRVLAAASVAGAAPERMVQARDLGEAVAAARELAGEGTVVRCHRRRRASTTTATSSSAGSASSSSPACT